MSSSDSQQNQSQSELNLNKLNPDDQSQSQSEILSNNIVQQANPQLTHKPNSSNNSQITKTVSVPHPLPLIKSEIVIPKKQLNLVKESKPRLIIDHMVLKNFKSYAGVQKIGPFHKNFTSIVGPNGSGKSNLIQSMLFIFGFSASWMRLKNLHQLIHNSHSATNVGSAAVQVHFKKILDNSDGSTTQIPGSQFFIRRTVNTSSVSKYYINGEDSTQLEVKTKLKSQGIDLTNNRFLILQGQVEQISQMKQKSGDKDKPGFLQYLQDIIGSNIFIERIDQALKQYNQAEESRHQKGQRMKIIQEQVKGMTSQKQQAIKYVKKQRKIFQIQTVLHQVIRSNCNYQLKKGQQKISQLEKRKDQIIQRQKQKMAKQSQRIAQMKKIRNQSQKYQKQISRDAQKISQLSAEDKNYKNQIAYNSEDQVRYQKKIEDLNQQFNKIIEQSDLIKKTLPQKQKKLAEQKKQLQGLKIQLAKYDKPELRQKIKNYENQIKKCNHAKTTMNEKKKFLISQVQKIQHSKGGHQHKKQQYLKLLQQNMTTKAKIQLAIQLAQKNTKQRRRQYENEIKQRNRLKNECDTHQMLMKQRSSQRMEQGQFNNMFNHIMKANIPGVIGRLGELGEINNKYDQIITTACGRLDNIVTQNYEAANAVLQFLKQNKLGRVTCIILDKISEFKNYMARPFEAPAGSMRLFDLINPVSQQARLAFYFALSNTLYCQNVDQAMKISLGDENNRRRVIAKKQRGPGFAIYQMNGVINTVMPRKGGFQRKVMKKPNQNQQKQFIKKLQQLTRLLQNKNQICKNIQKSLRQEENGLQQMKAQTVVNEGKIKDITEELRDIDKMMERNKGKKQQQEKMKKQITAIQSQIQKIQGQLQRQQRGLQAVENEQKKYQTSQTTEKRQRYKALRQEFAKLQKQVQKQQVLISTVQKRIRQNQSKKQSTQKAIERLQKMVLKTKQDIKRIQDIGYQLSKAMTQNKRKIDQLKRRQEEIKKQLDVDGNQIMESKRKIQEAKAAVDNAKRQIRKLEEDSKFANSQLERIRKLYTQMTSTYDFMTDIDQIQKMNIDQNSGLNSSILDVTIHNTSLNQSHLDIPMTTGRKSRGTQQSRVLDLARLDKVNPSVDLTEDQLDAYLLCQARLRNLLTNESQILKKMQGKNLQIISQYRRKFTEYKARVKQFQEVKQRQAHLKKLINDLKDQRFQMFRQGFSIINSKLKQVYQLLTNGGDAQLQLIDSLDPFSDGVNFSVRPPKKAWKQINKLSGGQKTLSSLSLIFALHYYKPTPLYFMDQIDAALDFKNVSIVGQYIKKRTKDAQFIIISLRNNMFDLADKLVGVYKTFDKTKVINLAAAKLLAKKQHLTNDQQNKEKQNENQNIPSIAQL